MGVDAVFVRFCVVVKFGGDVHYECFVFADAFKAVIDQGWNLQEHGIMVAHEEFVDYTMGGRTFAGIVEYDFHHAADDDEVIGLKAVVMPGFCDARIGGCEVNLAEFEKNFVVGAQHFHKATTFVGHNFELLDAYILNQLFGHKS